MIVGYVGRPGSGKSLALVYDCVNRLLKGESCYTNFRLDWKGILHLAWMRGHRPDRWEGWGAVAERIGKWTIVEGYADMCDVAEGRLYFDEAHIWLWSRAWAELPRDVISWWSQSRKHGVEVLWASQRLNSIDAHVRELTAEIWHCRQIFGSRRFLYQLEDMESTDRSRRIWKRKLVKLDTAVAACYDTREILPPPYELGQSGKVVAREPRSRRVPSSARVPAAARSRSRITLLEGTDTADREGTGS